MRWLENEQWFAADMYKETINTLDDLDFFYSCNSEIIDKAMEKVDEAVSRGSFSAGIDTYNKKDVDTLKIWFKKLGYKVSVREYIECNLLGLREAKIFVVKINWKKPWYKRLFGG